MSTLWVYDQLETQGFRARNDWNKNSKIWPILETKNIHSKSNLFSIIFQDCICFCWPNSFYYIFITFPEQKNKDWSCELGEQNSTFDKESGDWIFCYKEIQGLSRLAINSWQYLGAIWTITTPQHLQKPHIQIHGLFFILEFGFENLRIINDF